MLHNLSRIFIVILLPLGFLAAVVGIKLRDKYEGTPNENIIVTGSMLGIVTIGFTIIFIYFKYFR